MATNGPVPQSGILDISPYVPGESSVPGGVKPIKLSSNETPLGPSPKAIAAYKAEANTWSAIPTAARRRLRKAIAEQLRAQRRAHRLRRGLGRADQPDRARLRRAGRRGASTPSTAS